MRAIIEVLRSIGLWLATGSMGVRPLILTLPRPNTEIVRERRLERRAASPERRVVGR